MRRRSGPIRDTDSEAASRTVAILALGTVPGLIMGAALGHLFGWNILVGGLVLGVPMASAIWGATHLIVTRSGAATTGLYTPTGDSTPYRGGMSREEAMIASGRLDEAIECLTARAQEDPGDPRPPLRLASLYRDELGDNETAVTWFRRAAAVEGFGLEGERQVLRELVEVCRDRLGRPELAASALRRAADLHQGDRLGHWAQQELRALKAPPG